ncbi:hypothetical protein SCUCBS95973_002988 [Sporothrix curviconia]|uniref:Zn(2)-C6 fungal-type domain-containing protein n=1 Tax=Sporothrix curviconia TaxID=1260050 RepID=A0ABP0BBL1_9PEZI
MDVHTILTPASAETADDHSDQETLHGGSGSVSPAGPSTSTSTTPSTVSKQNAPRSCLACNARKTRCDKQQPCQSCARAGRACLYPPAGPRVRRTKKAIMATMATRIAALEKQLNEAKSKPSMQVEMSTGPSITARQPRKDTAATHRTKSKEYPTPPAADREDILVQNGSSSQYFNEVILSRVMADDDGLGHSLMLSAAQSPVAGAPSSLPPALSPFNALGILSSPLPSPPARLHPPKAVAFRLWNIFVDRVDGCSGHKLLHVPTDQVRVFAAIHDPATAPYEDLALAFAIYYAARVADEADEEEDAQESDQRSAQRSDQREHQKMERRKREDDLLRYKVGLEQSLAHGDFLDKPTLTGLLALAIYLAALRFCNRGKGLWVLNGLAVRVAQSLGLHRDGGRLKSLSPFDAEIRRRLWWHLLSRDWRASEDYGLEGGNSSATRSFLLDTDVLLPLNVDDQLLYPGMKEMPPAHEGWTAMTFSLIHIELCRTAQRLAVEASLSEAEGGSSSSETVRAGIIANLRADIERRLVHCNFVIPQQRMTILCARFLLRKLDFVSRLQWAIRRGAGRGSAGDHDQNAKRKGRRAKDDDLVSDAHLVEALAILRPRLFREDEVLVQYAWARKAYPQYHVGMYVLWHLCRQPTGPHVDEAWEAVDMFFAREEGVAVSGSGRGVGLGSKFAVLAALKAKAETVREKVRSDTVGKGTSADAYILPDMPRPVAEPVPAVDDTNTTAAPLAAASPSLDFDDFLLDTEMLDFGLDDVWAAWGDGQPMLL